MSQSSYNKTSVWMRFFNFRYYLKKYESVFSGNEFVDWLIERELVSSREEAVEYGHSLMLGRVIAHVANEHYFHDDNYFYKFLNDSSV